MPVVIDTVAWVRVENGTILCARPRGRDIFYVLGGKREGTESDLETLLRESARADVRHVRPALHLKAQRDGGRTLRIEVCPSATLVDKFGNLRNPWHFGYAAGDSAGRQAVLPCDAEPIAVAVLRELAPRRRDVGRRPRVGYRWGRPGTPGQRGALLTREVDIRPPR